VASEDQEFAAWLESAAVGDADAYGRIFENTHLELVKRANRLLTSITSDVAAIGAEDLVQGFFVQLLPSANQSHLELLTNAQNARESRSAFINFAVESMREKALKLRQVRSAHRRTSTPEEPIFSDDVVLKATLREAIATLESDAKDFIHLRFDAELSLKEIAQLKNVSESALKSQQASIIERLRHIFFTPAGHKDSCQFVDIFFGTDRLRSGKASWPSFYGSGRAPAGILSTGTCRVSIPTTSERRVGTLSRPTGLRRLLPEDPRLHVILHSISVLSEDEFFHQLREATCRSKKKDAFVFVHGYNVSFHDAALRTAQLAADLKFQGAPILYSWPSNGTSNAYLKDETNVEWTAPHFKSFLDVIVARSGAERIHIIAHSMGNRAVCNALKVAIDHRGGDLNAKLQYVILAAPDIDAETFEELANVIQSSCQRITLYASSKDKALQASRAVHGYKRAGEPLVVIAGLDTIDASTVDTDFLSHSYFSSHRHLLNDVYGIFDDRLPADRFDLQQVSSEKGTYYVFRA
jgi:RNA polymerase sigma factor (sigma-70 family)